MKHIILLLLGTVVFVAFGFAAELGLLPDDWAEWAPWALMAFGVVVLLFAWRSWGRLMAWVFGKDDDEIK